MNRHIRFILSILALSLLNSQVCFSQNKRIQYFDEYWQRTQDKYEMKYYRVIYYDSNGKPQGKIHDYYKSGKLQWEGYLISDDPEIIRDTARWYFESGKLKEIAVFTDGIKNGLNTTYNENGTLESNVQYVNGQISGDVTGYYENGKVKSMNYFDSLSKTKKYISYHPNGVIKHRSILKNDTSWSWTFNEDGSIQQQGRYIRMAGHDHSENDGDLIYYYRNGQISTRRPFKEGKILGMDSNFYESGKVREVTPYEDSKENGQSIRFYENGNIQERHNWNKGKQDGEQTEYYPNGNIKRISYKSNGQDTGSMVEYEQNGQILKNKPLWDTAFVYSKSGNKLKEMNLTGPGKHYESLIFDESGTLTEKYFKDCQYCNINKTYYFFPTGRIKKALYYSSDMKPTIDSSWYHNGKLQAVVRFNDRKVTSIEYYDNKGILIDNYVELHIAKDVSTCLMGFKNDQGKWVVKPEYKVLTELKNGYSMAMKNDLWGVIDNKGRIIMPLMFSDVDIQTVIHFNENAINPPIKYPLFSSSTHNQFNKIREELTPMQFKKLLTMYTELPIPDNYVFFIITTKNYQAIYDEHQNVVIPAQKYSLTVLSEKYFGITETAPIEEHNRNQGVLNRAGKVIVPCIYRWINFVDGKYFIVDKKTMKGDQEYSSRGVLNCDGIEILPFNYDNVEYDRHDIFTLKKDENIGFFNGLNKRIAQPVYDYYYTHYTPDVIIKVKRNGKYGLLDGSFNVLLPVVYEQLEEVYKNDSFKYWIFSLNNKYGIMSAEGKTIVPYGFQWLEKHDYNHIGWYFFSENKKWGLMDDDFNIVLKPRFIKINQKNNQRNTLYCATTDSLFVYTVTGGNNFIKRIPVKSEFSFSSGLKVVCFEKYIMYNSEGELMNNPLEKSESEQDVCGLFNPDGKFILPPVYKIIMDEAGNYSASSYRKNELIQLDLDGNITLKIKNYTGIADNYMGFITVETRNGKLGVIDQKGRLLIDTLYEAISKYDAENQRFWVKETIDTNQWNDMAPYDILRLNWALIDTSGKLLTKSIYVEPVEFSDGVAIVNTKNGVGIIDINGKVVIPEIYSEIIPQVDGNYILYNEEKGFGIADKSGKIIFEAGSFDNITEAINGYYIFFKTKKIDAENNITYTGLIDPSLKIIVPALPDKFLYNEKNLYKLIIKDYENTPVARTPKPDEYLSNLEIKDLVENEDYLKADSIPDENKKRIIMNYLIGLYGLKISYLFEGYLSYQSKELQMFYSTNKYHFEFSWYECYGDMEQQNISYYLTNILDNCFSITEESYGSWTGCHSAGGISDAIIIFNNLRINKNKLDTLSLDDLFTDKKNYPDILNAILESQLQQKSEMKFSCDTKVTVLEMVHDNFIISRNALKFYLKNEGAHYNDFDMESLYIELVIPWKDINSLINKKLLAGIDL